MCALLRNLVFRLTSEPSFLLLTHSSPAKLAAANPKSVNKPDQAPTFYRYTPGQQGENFNAGAKQRIVRIVDMPVDPMEPPKFRHKKVPNGKTGYARRLLFKQKL